ncbi:MAG: NAD(P)H-hydrate epimerase, partial [FCB group bacterium]|nr:NAD(P)H-hydrate epimerase [FCB group bacterium]
MIRIVTAEAARMIDRDAMNIRGVSGIDLMAAAGKAVADTAAEMCRQKNLSHVQIFCGPGNNGGDGFVAAYELQRNEIPHVDVFIFCGENTIRGDARCHFDRMVEAGIHPILIHTGDDCASRLNVRACWIDALFGTGLDRPVEGLFLDVMHTLQTAHGQQPVIAVDIPSGVHGTSGYLLGPALKADITVCMGFYKTGNFLYEGKALCGRLQPVELPYPEASFAHAVPPVVLCERETIRERLKPLKTTDHKYTAGQVLCLGGSAAMPGAVTLAAQAALKSGAGILRALVPGSVKPILLHHLIEAIVDEGQNEQILVESDLPRIRSLCGKSRSVLLGPGLGQASASGRLTRTLVRELPLPLVLDADALFALHPEDMKDCPAPRVITPHAGEFARLLNTSTDVILHAPIEHSLEAARQTGAIVHLKGST